MFFISKLVGYVPQTTSTGRSFFHIIQSMEKRLPVIPEYSRYNYPFIYHTQTASTWPMEEKSFMCVPNGQQSDAEHHLDWESC